MGGSGGVRGSVRVQEMVVAWTRDQGPEDVQTERSWEV